MFCVGEIRIYVLRAALTTHKTVTMGNCRSRSASTIAEWVAGGNVDAELCLLDDTSMQLPAGLVRLHLKSGDGLHCLSNLIALRNLQSLSLADCDARTLPYLRALITLQMRYCTSLRALPSLPVLTALHCESCYELRTLPPLPNHRELRLEHCRNLGELPVLPNLRELRLYDCPALRELPPLRNLERLELFRCRAVRKLPPFPALRGLDIWFCPGLSGDYVAAPCEHCGVPKLGAKHLFRARYAALPDAVPPEGQACGEEWQQELRLQHAAARWHVILPPAAMLFV